jgi:hypothetical protein
LNEEEIEQSPCDFVEPGEDPDADQSQLFSSTHFMAKTFSLLFNLCPVLIE